MTKYGSWSPGMQYLVIYKAVNGWTAFSHGVHSHSLHPSAQSTGYLSTIAQAVIS